MNEINENQWDDLSRLKKSEWPVWFMKAVFAYFVAEHKFYLNVDLWSGRC